MSEKNITELSEMENINISEEDLPDVISEQFEAIVDIDKRIVEAENRCATAKETADKMILAKALNQKDAINATQDAVRSLAEAQTALSDAQRMLFENQQKMALYYSAYHAGGPPADGRPQRGDKGSQGRSGNIRKGYMDHFFGRKGVGRSPAPFYICGRAQGGNRDVGSGGKEGAGGSPYLRILYGCHRFKTPGKFV